MGTLRSRLIFILAALALPVAAWAQAQHSSGPWEIPAGPTALFKPDSTTYVLVVAEPLKTPPQGWVTLPHTLNAYSYASSSSLGIERTRTGWQIAAHTAAAPQTHALLLNHRWRLGKTTVQRTEVAYGGRTWHVGLTPFNQRGAQALLGVALRSGAAPKLAAAEPVSAAQPKAQAQPQRVAKAEAALARYVAIEPAAGLAPVPMPNVVETDLLSSVQAVLTTPVVLPLRGLPVEIYKPGTLGAIPAAIMALKLPDKPTAPALPSPTFDVPEISGTDVLSGTEPHAALAAAEENAHAEHQTHGAPKPAAAGHGAEIAAEINEDATSPTLPMVRETIAETVSESGEGEALGMMFLPRSKNAFMQMAEALQAVADAPVGSAAGREARLELAGIYLSWQRPEEAMSVLRTMPLRADGLPANALPRLLYGIAQLAAGGVAPEASFDQRGEMAKHAALWAAVAQAKQRNYSLAVQNWPRERGILPDYPAYLRELAQQAQLEALLMTGQQEAAAQGIAQMAKAYPAGRLPPKLSRLQGLALLGGKEEQQGLEALAKAAENTTDAETAMRAKFEFIRALHQRRDVSDAQLREYLETLQQDWRGDDTEREVLGMLADLYEKNREPHKALITWQTIVGAFPRAPELPLITARMAQAFVSIYDPESEQIYDPLTYLGIYYDFRELLPNDDVGDRVQEFIAERLIKANLYERAIPLLEQQINFRPLEDVARGRLSLMLAEANRNIRKPEEAYKLLNENRALASTQILRRGWALAEAKALADLQRPQAGLKVLEPLLTSATTDKEAKVLAAELAWRGQDWSTTSRLLNDVMASVPSSVLVSDTMAQLNLFRWAYALGQQKKAEELGKLKARYTEAWGQLPRLADDVNAVAASSGLAGVSPEGGAMQALTTALSGLNTIDDRIAKMRRDLDTSRSTREEYNNRMEYMDLLPPPAL
ncbi:MAG: hypothetical protein ACK5YK_01995 [Pseudomonadota bacterium]